MSCLDQLNSDFREQLLRAVALGNCNVLLGAGASCDSLGADGELIPLAGALAEQIAEHFSLPPDKDLGSSYERACVTFGDDEVIGYLRGRFEGTKPAAWYSQFVQLPWKRIWTLNIDDVAERAYTAWASTAFQRPTSRSWRDPFDKESASEIVHLHGRVSSDPPDLVFAILEYINVRDQRTSRHPIFGDQWKAQPFIVVGSRLISEYDLADVFRRRQPGPEIPSLYVAHELDDVMRFDLKRWGLNVVEASASQFIADLYDDVQPRVRRSERPWMRSGLHRASAIFNQQFRQLDPDQPGEIDISHDLYHGDQPVWRDVCENLDAEQAWCRRISDAVTTRNYIEKPTRLVHVAYGPRLCGKSTGLLRMAKEVAATGIIPFLFRAEQGLNVDALISVLEENEDFVLLFDGIADHAAALSIVFERTAKTVPVRVVAVEREVRMNQVQNGLGTRLAEDGLVDIGAHEDRKRGWRASDRHVRLNPADAKSLVSTLDSRGRLGLIATMSPTAQEGVFRTHGVFAGMEVVTLGASFKQRIERMVQQVKNESTKRALALVSILDTFGIAAPIDLLTVCADRKGRQVDTSQVDFRELVEVRHGFVYSRHRTLTLQPIVDSFSKDDLLDLLAAAMNFVRPYVTYDSIKQGSLHALIAKGLMRAKSLMLWIGLNHVDEYYDRIANDYDWNSRLWEQRAIAAELLLDWERASSYGAKACTMTGDEYRLNTYGTVLINRALHTTEVGTADFYQLYRLARKQFNEAHDYRPTNPVPLLTHLQELVKISTAFRKAGLDVDAELLRDWDACHKKVLKQPVFSKGLPATELAEVSESWMRSFDFGR